MSKKLLFITAVLIGLVVTVIFSASFWYINASKPVSTSADVVRFVVSKGASASQVGNKLNQAGLIRSPLAFKIYLQFTNSSKSVKPGEFTLKKNLDLKSVVTKLLEGPDEIWVTIPEGFRREEIVEKVIEQLNITDPNFRKDFLSKTVDLEGYLFPDTYLFPSDVSVDRVIKVLNDTFEKKYQQIVSQTAGEKVEYDKDSIVTMASIVERETKSTDERPVVAGILWKRLATSGWFIQADATVQYVLGSNRCKSQVEKCSWWPAPSKEDLEIQSSFNTYKNKSLPPRPIANAGEASLRAAMYPQNSDYWFYIHGEDGRIHYAKTIEEHNRNVSDYIR